MLYCITALCLWLQSFWKQANSTNSDGKTHILFFISFIYWLFKKLWCKLSIASCFLIWSQNSWRSMKIWIHTRNIWNHHCALGHRISFFSPLGLLIWLLLSWYSYMLSIIMLSLVKQESSAIPFTDSKVEYIKLKINTELLFGPFLSTRYAVPCKVPISAPIQRSQHSHISESVPTTWLSISN